MGRKLNRSAARTKSGRISRAKANKDAERRAAWDKQERDTMGVVLEARARIFGLSGPVARDQMAGSFIGRLCLGNKDGNGLSRAQYEALLKWEESARSSAACLAGPKGDTAQDPNHVAGRSALHDDARDARTIAKHEEARKAVQTRQNELGLQAALFAALYECVQRDREVYHMVGSLREAANALVRHYGLEQQVAA